VYAVEVREHIMIAHSFRGAVFGPAQELHGATFVIDAAFMADSLDDNGIVIDIGCAHEALKATLGPLNYRNLDAIPAFAGRNTTTEFLAAYIHGHLAEAARSGEALLAFGPVPEQAAATATLNLSARGDLVEAAVNLFSHLRALDRSGARIIAVMTVPREGLGEAINDRLDRAAAPRT
jgi:6-pyruvoyl-tetrahydropterin synthase